MPSFPWKWVGQIKNSTKIPIVDYYHIPPRLKSYNEMISQRARVSVDWRL